MSEEELDQSLNRLKPKTMSLYDPKASKDRENELNTLREKYFTSSITQEEENRLHFLESDPSGLV